MEEILNNTPAEIVTKVKRGDATFRELWDIFLFSSQKIGEVVMFLSIFNRKVLLIGLALFLFGILNRILKRVSAAHPEPEKRAF